MIRRLLIALAMMVPATGCDSLVTRPTPYTTVTVYAQRRDSSPVPGVPVTLYTGQRPMGYATTGTDGRATFDRVPKGPAYGVLAEAPAGWAFVQRLTGGPLDNHRDGLVLVPDSAVTLRFTFLKVGPGTVAGRVTDEGGTPLAAVNVALYSPAGILRRAVTGMDGTVRFPDVPFGVYGLAIDRPRGYRDVGESAAVFKDGLLVEEGVVVTATATLARCAGTLGVRVADPARGPAAGLTAYLYDATAVLDSARTGSDGRVTFSSGCGEFGVFLGGTPDWIITPARGSQYVDGIVVHRGERRDVDLAVRYNACRWQVAVRVTDAAGSLIPGAAIESYDALGNREVRPVPTGETTFSNLPCGLERGVRVTSPEGWTVTPGRGSSFFDGLSGTDGQVVPVRFILRRP
ncbi:MAG: MSCRAMM family protein [Gemmatimonadaceae bacterium]